MTARRRLLFVDDEAPILRALERTLHGHRHEWEFAFCDDPAKALDLVDSFAPDGVVSDMRMPHLDGAEFLVEAARRRPAMARFILSGDMSAGSVVRMAMAAHQCLLKPFRSDVLTRVLFASLIDSATVKVPALLQGLYSVRGLPVAPEPFTALRRDLSCPPSPLRDASAIRLIEGSAGIATKLMQVAAWARLGHGEPPLTVSDAFYVLSPDVVTALLDSELLRPQAGEPPSPLQLTAWTRCDRVGPVATAIATLEGFTFDEVSRLRLVTLWSAAAPLLLDSICPQDYSRVREAAATSGTSLAALEQEHFGVTATQAMTLLLRLWGLPPELIVSVARTGDAAALPPDELSTDGIAHVAAALVDAFDGAAVPEATLAYLDRLGLGSRLAGWRAMAAEPRAGARRIQVEDVAGR